MKIKKIDLHTHTNISDGIYSPEELIDIAIEKDLIALAITDHDTIGGIERATVYAREKDIKFIPGVEFSLGYSGGSFHLLGLYIDHNNLRLKEILLKLQNARIDRARKIVAELSKHGIDISYDDVEEEIESGAIGKPHIARILIKKGYAKDIPDVFKNYLMKGKPGYVEKENISVEEATDVIYDAGGIPIIAHPASLRYTSIEKFEEMVIKLIDIGIIGIEVYSSMHTMEEVFDFYKIARKYNLLISGGSDYHGDKKKVEIGTYLEGKYIPIEVFDEIESYRASFF